MRTIATFVFFVIVCCGFLTAPFTIQPAYPQTSADGSGKDSPFGFSAYTQAGIFYGQSEEIVYWNSLDADYYSQLLWDMKPLVYAGAGASFSMNEFRDALGVYADLSFKAGIPFRTGIMEDRDWLNPSDLTMLTNYAVTENYTTRAFLTDFALGVSIPLKYRDRVFAFLKLGGAVSYRYFDWTGRGGYAQEDFSHGVDPSDLQMLLDGDVIAYYQHWLTVSPGFALLIPIRSRWLIEVSLNAVSGSIWVWALDKHLYKEKMLQENPGYNQNQSTEFQDRLAGGILLEPGLEVSYRFNAHLALGSYVSYRYIQNSRGDNRNRRMTGVYSVYPPWTRNNTAGAGFLALDAGLTLKASF
ncbi:MAG: omptin family outer membrane protease [Treponema sp.]|jgi:outer membrane protease|nr:omptin family outer membrane protease [Treponema sp.]